MTTNAPISLPLLVLHSPILSPLDIHHQSFTGVTLVNQLSSFLVLPLTSSLDRVDRFPYLLKRWNGPISTVFFIHENETANLAHFIMTQTREGIDYTVYVIKSTRSAPFIRWKGTVKKYPFSIYPVNTLRDLGIESIKTSHYLLLDIDVLPSINLYNSILLNKGILARDPHNVLLFQLFQFNKAIIKQQRTMPQFKKLYLLEKPSTVDGTAFL